MTPAGDVIPVTLVVGWIGGSAWQAALGMARKLPEAVLLHPFTSERSLRCEAYQLDEVVSAGDWMVGTTLVTPSR